MDPSYQTGPLLTKDSVPLVQTGLIAGGSALTIPAAKAAFYPAAGQFAGNALAGGHSLIYSAPTLGSSVAGLAIPAAAVVATSAHALAKANRMDQMARANNLRGLNYLESMLNQTANDEDIYEVDGVPEAAQSHYNTAINNAIDTGALKYYPNKTTKDKIELDAVSGAHPKEGNSMNPEITALEQAGKSPEEIAAALTPSGPEEEVNPPEALKNKINKSKAAGSKATGSGRVRSSKRITPSSPYESVGSKYNDALYYDVSASRFLRDTPRSRESQSSNDSWLKYVLPALLAAGGGYLLAKH
jgi:hypothetical protein